MERSSLTPRSKTGPYSLPAGSAEAPPPPPRLPPFEPIGDSLSTLLCLIVFLPRDSKLRESKNQVCLAAFLALPQRGVNIS